MIVLQLTAAYRTARYRPAARTRRRRTLRGRADAAACAGGRARSISASARPRRRLTPACSGVKAGRRGEKRVRDAFVLLRLARAGGVDQAAARRDRRRRVLEHRQLGGGERRQIRLRAGASGCRDRGAACRGRSRARRRARSRTRARRAAAAAGRPARCGRCAAPLAATVRRSSSTRRSRTSHATSSPRPSISAPQSPSSCRRARRRCRARARPGDRRPAASTSCDASSCTTNQPCVLRRSPRSGCPSSTIRPSGAKAVGCDLDRRRPRAARSARRA